MKYVIYFKFYDGTQDSITLKNAIERDAYIKNLIDDNEIKSVSYCKVYKSGEYGKRTFVKGTYLD